MIVTAIGKDILLFGVCVQVEEHCHSMLVLHDVLFDGCHFWALGRLGVAPGAIEVIPGEVAPRVAQDHSVGVGHGEDFDQVVFEKSREQ